MIECISECMQNVLFFAQKPSKIPNCEKQWTMNEHNKTYRAAAAAGQQQNTLNSFIYILCVPFRYGKCAYKLTRDRFICLDLISLNFYWVCCVRCVRCALLGLFFFFCSFIQRLFDYNLLFFVFCFIVSNSLFFGWFLYTTDRP